MCHRYKRNIGDFDQKYENINVKVYISEILDEERRGLGAAMYSVLHSFGFFLVLFTGEFS